MPLKDSPEAPPLPQTGPQPPSFIDFGGAPPQIACTYNECTAGHKFLPQVQIAQCPGCKGPILAVKMVQCPICNEPIKELVLRQEHLPQGGQITPLCMGAATLNEASQIKLLRSHAVEEQARYAEREMISKA